MSHDAALCEIRRFDAELPIERAFTPPASWYLREDVDRLERERVFSAGWQPVARVDELAEPGDFVTARLGGEPVVVLRDRGGGLRALSNVCRHHAAELVTGSGRCDTLVCPYHGWTYTLEGRLLRAPGLSGVRGLDRDELALPAFAAGEWGPFVWACAAPQAAPLGQALGELAALGDALWSPGLRFVARRRYTLECNWKVVVDNYLDGGYHVPVLHGGLAAGLELDAYATELGKRCVVQRVPARAGGPDPRLGAGALYAWLYPALMLNRYGPVLDTNRVLPIGPARCEIVYDWWLEPEAAADAAFVEHSLAASHQVQLEDTQICESVQRGLTSAHYDRGRYAPAHEAGMHHFHRLLASQLA